MKKLLMISFVALTLVFQSCTNNDDLWSAIDDLKGRVQALETQVKALNNNIEALQQLYGNGKTITKVEMVGDKYVLTLSDGSKIELKQGTDAEVNMPLIGIDEDGYWQVSYNNGATWERLDAKASGSDGLTPTFRVDEATGYWQISYDEGATWANVVDTKGNPVKAVGSGLVTDKFFDKAEVRGGMFYIKLHDGTEFNIPILKDFLCVIHTPTEGVQKFNLAEEKTFRVEIKGADNAIVTAPDGWVASLSEIANNEATLTVTAPDMATRAAADNSKDVAILITSNAYAAISKIQVELDNVARPTATVAASTTTLPTSTSVTFDVTTTDAEGWKYICQPAALAAPTATEVLNSGTVGSGASVTVSDLSYETAYKFYVVAYMGALKSEVVSAEAATTARDFYKEGITIDGVTFKEGDADVTLVTATTTITKDSGVYFLDPEEGAEISISGVTGNGFEKLVVIGRYSNVQPRLKVIANISLRGRGNVFGFIFKNIFLDASSFTSYIFNNAGSDATGVNERFWFEDCKIHFAPGGSLTYLSSAGSIKKAVIRNSRVITNATTAQAVNVFNFSNASAASALQSIEMSNNFFYSPTNEPKLVLASMSNTAASDQVAIQVLNNTLVNTPLSNGGVSVGKVKSITMSKNIIWWDSTVNTSCYMCKMTNATVVADVTDNKVYNRDALGFVVTGGGVLPDGVTENPKILKEESDPFAGGTFDLANGQFTPNATYAGYGARLK